MAEAVCDGPTMMRQLCGTGQGVTDEAGDALPQRGVATLALIGLAGRWRDGFGVRGRKHPCVDSLVVRLAQRGRAVSRRQLGPQRVRPLVTAVCHVTRHAVAWLLVHGDPAPRCVRLALAAAPPLVGFHLQAPDAHLPGRRPRPPMPMLRQGRTAHDETVHEPPQTDANCGCGSLPT
jgi:hypothetical protein